MDPNPRRALPRGNPGDYLPTSPPAGTYLVTGEPNPPTTDIPSVLRRRWPIIVGGALVVATAAAAFALTRPTIYQSSTTFLVEAADDGNRSALEVLEGMGKASGIDTEMELMRSRRVMLPAAEELALHVRVLAGEEPLRAKEVLPELRAGREAEPGSYRLEATNDGWTVRDTVSGEVLARARPGEVVEFEGFSFRTPRSGGPYTIRVGSILAAAQGLQGSVSVSTIDRESDLIRLTCTSRTAEGAYEMCDAVSQSYLDMRAELQRAEATAAAQFLHDQVASVGARLAAAEDSLGDYQEANLAIALDARANAEVGQMANFQGQRDQLAAERAALSQLITTIESGGGGGTQYRNLASFPTFLRDGNPIVGNLLGSIVELENRRSELAKTRTDRNPDIVAIDNRIDEIEDQLRSIAVNYADALDVQISSLGRVAGQAGGRMAAIPRKQVQSARLERQVALLDDLYRFLQTRLREAEMVQSTSMPKIQIVDPATIPTGPIPQGTFMRVALGVVLGLAFGFVLAFYRERSDTRVRDRQAIEQNTGVPVLAMVPRMHKPGPVLPVSRGSRDGSRLPVSSKWENEISREAFRSLVADLQIAARNMQNGGLRSVAVTSSTRGEGKTLSACNLALAQVDSAVRTLLIDTDLRGKGVARFFRLASLGPGLSDVLSGSARIDEVIQSVEVDGQGELFIMPSGAARGWEQGLFEVSRIDDLLREVKSRFDVVILDTPPLNVLSDTATIVACVDAVLLVVRGGMTDREALDLTLDRLNRTRSHLMGIVLNDVDLPAYYTSYSHVASEVD